MYSYHKCTGFKHYARDGENHKQGGPNVAHNVAEEPTVDQGQCGECIATFRQRGISTAGALRAMLNQQQRYDSSNENASIIGNNILKSPPLIFGNHDIRGIESGR